MDKLEDGLKDTKWFTGANFGIADAAIFPYVLRWEQLTLSDYCNENSHPKLNDWFNRVKNLPFYEEQILSFLSDHSLHFRSVHSYLQFCLLHGASLLVHHDWFVQLGEAW